MSGGARFATYDVPNIRVNFSRATVAEQSNEAAEAPETAEQGAWSVANEDGGGGGVVRVGELGHMSRVMCVAVAPRTACMVATGDVHGVVTLWHAQSGRELFRVALCVDDARRTFSCTDVQWSGDESVVVVGGVAGLRSVWSRVDDACAVTVAPIVVIDVASGTVVCQLDDGHASEVWSVRCVYVCGLRCVVSAGEDGRVLRWQLAANYAALCR